MKKKTFKRLHLWLAVPFGLIISLVCFSGAMIAFAEEISEWAYRDRYTVSPTAEGRLPMQEIVRRVTPKLDPGVTVTGVTVPRDSTRVYELNLSAPPRTEWLVDPYTGNVTGVKEHLPFFETMFRLHRWLLDFPHEGEGVWWGKMIVGVSTLLFLFVLISGLIAWWPRTTRGLRKQLALHFRRGAHRLWLDLHTIVGAYVSVLLLAMAVTGLTWSFGWYRAGFYKLLGSEAPPPKGGHGHGGKGGASRDAHGERRRPGDGAPADGVAHAADATTTFAAWERSAALLRAKYPEADAVEIGEDGGKVSLGQWGNVRAADQYTFDVSGTHITETKRYADAKRQQRIRGWIYSVHTGRWGGWPMRLLQALVALFGATLPLSGYYLWWKRLRRASQNKA